jgi:type II protein arginine methyltransferase
MEEITIQEWHLLMLNNQVRNVAFYRALLAKVKPGDLVLDVGTGTGLLSMMAARVGADHVYTCEVNSLMYKKALEIIDRNGLSDRITVFNKLSFDLTSQDLPLCDVLVTETIADDVFGENILKVVSDAQHRLLKPQARIIPQTARVYLALIESQHLMEKLWVFPENTCGFDLSPFNEYQGTWLYVTPKDIPYYQMLSEPIAVFDVDFTQPYAQEKETLVELKHSGTCHGFLIWGEYQLSDGNYLSTGPTSPQTSWHQMFYSFANAGVGILVKEKQLAIISFKVEEDYPYGFRLIS